MEMQPTATTASTATTATTATTISTDRLDMDLDADHRTPGSRLSAGSEGPYVGHQESMNSVNTLNTYSAGAGMTNKCSTGSFLAESSLATSAMASSKTDQTINSRPSLHSDWTELKSIPDLNPLSQYMNEEEQEVRVPRKSCVPRIKKSLRWFYGVPRTQTFNLHQLRIHGTTDAKFVDIVQNLMNVRSGDATDMDEVSTMLRDTRQDWSFFDILEADVPRALYWVLCRFSILGQMIQTSLAMIAFYSSWYCSLIVAYDPILIYDHDLNPSSGTYRNFQRFDIALDLLFFFGTLGELRTTFIDRSHFVETCRPSKIFRRTVRSVGFWMDLLSCFPAVFVYVSEDAPLQLLLIKVLIRLRCTLVWIFDANNVGLQMQPYWQQILRLVLFIMLVGHMMGCLWYSVSADSGLAHPLLADAGGGERWVVPRNADRPLFLYYTYFSKTGLYLALGIIVQGYSLVENAFIVVLAPLGSVVNALVLSTIIVLVSRKTALETHTLEQVANLKQAITTQGLPATIQLRLMAYHTQKRVHRCRSQTGSIFRGLSNQLHFELNLVLYCNLLIEADIFKKSHPRVIRRIVLVFEDKLFLPGDYVCRYDDEGSEMYFIFKGCLDVFSDSYVLLCQMKKGQHFGEVALLTGQRRTAYVQARMFCMLASLSKANFDNIMREYPQQYDVIMQQMSAKRRAWMQNLVKQQQKEKEDKNKTNLKRTGSLLAGTDAGDQENMQTTAKSALKRAMTVGHDQEYDPHRKNSCGSHVSFSEEVSKNKHDATGRISGHVTVVIPFTGESEGNGYSSHDQAYESEATKSSMTSGEEDDDAKDSNCSESEGDRGSDSEEDSEEDIEELANAVHQHCSMAFKGNERICARLKEVTQRQAQSAELASKMSDTFAELSLEQTAEDRSLLLEDLCTDMDHIQRAIKECAALDTAGEDQSASHRNIIAMAGQERDEEEDSGLGDDSDQETPLTVKASTLVSASEDAERTVL